MQSILEVIALVVFLREDSMDIIIRSAFVHPHIAAPFVHHLAEAHGNKAISNTLGRGPVIDMLVHRILHHRRNHM